MTATVYNTTPGPLAIDVEGRTVDGYGTREGVDIDGRTVDGRVAHELIEAGLLVVTATTDETPEPAPSRRSSAAGRTDEE